MRFIPRCQREFGSIRRSVAKRSCKRSRYFGNRRSKIGIVSALAVDTVDTSSPGENVVFMDEIEALKADVAAMQGMGVDKIIALTHVGLKKDMEIAAAVPGLTL